MTEPEKVETEGPEIVAVEHPDPHIIGSDSSENAAADEAADEDEDRQSAIGSTIAEKAQPVPGQLTIQPEPEPEPEEGQS